MILLLIHVVYYNRLLGLVMPPFGSGSYVLLVVVVRGLVFFVLVIDYLLTVKVSAAGVFVSCGRGMHLFGFF